MIDIQFDGQKKNESVVGVYRISPLHYIKSIIVLMILILLPILITIFGGIKSYTTLLFVICLAIFFTNLFRTWYLWHNNLFIITNVRVIALTQEGFFDRKLRESYLESICLVTASIKGFLHTTFDFGKVLVQTEAEMWLEDIEKPYEAKDAIFNAIRDFKKNGNETKLNLVDDD
jgi:hypothetical protein